MYSKRSFDWQTIFFIFLKCFKIITLLTGFEVVELPSFHQYCYDCTPFHIIFYYYFYWKLIKTLYPYLCAWHLSKWANCGTCQIVNKKFFYSIFFELWGNRQPTAYLFLRFIHVYFELIIFVMGFVLNWSILSHQDFHYFFFYLFI